MILLTRRLKTLPRFKLLHTSYESPSRIITSRIHFKSPSLLKAMIYLARNKIIITDRTPEEIEIVMG